MHFSNLLSVTLLFIFISPSLQSVKRKKRKTIESSGTNSQSTSSLNSSLSALPLMPVDDSVSSTSSMSNSSSPVFSSNINSELNQLTQKLNSLSLFPVEKAVIVLEWHVKKFPLVIWREIISFISDHYLKKIPLNPNVMSTSDWIDAAEGMNLPQVFKIGTFPIRWKITFYINRWTIKKYGNESPEKFIEDPEVLRMIEIKKGILNIIEEEWKSWVFKILNSEISSETFDDRRDFIHFFLLLGTFLEILSANTPNSILSKLDASLSLDENLYKTGYIEETIRKFEGFPRKSSFKHISYRIENIKMSESSKRKCIENLKRLIPIDK